MIRQRSACVANVLCGSRTRTHRTGSKREATLCGTGGQFERRPRQRSPASCTGTERSGRPSGNEIITPERERREPFTDQAWTLDLTRRALWRRAHRWASSQLVGPSIATHLVFEIRGLRFRESVDTGSLTHTLALG